MSCTSIATEDLRAPYVPTPHDVVAEMLKLARVGEGDLLYDLGCGDGRIAIAAARDLGARAVGFDIDPRLVELARANVAAAGVGHLVRIELADIFDLDLRPASVVTLYLLQALNDRLVPQLRRLDPGTRIVSHQYRLRGIPHRREVSLRSREDPRHHTLFLWVAPLEEERISGGVRLRVHEGRPQEAGS
jgi:SAM-dependent methyltransferase